MDAAKTEFVCPFSVLASHFFVSVLQTVYITVLQQIFKFLSHAKLACTFILVIFTSKNCSEYCTYIQLQFCHEVPKAFYRYIMLACWISLLSQKAYLLTEVCNVIT